MQRDERLKNDANVPLAQQAGMLGSTEQEGGGATKDRPADELQDRFGSGNRHRQTTGATPETERGEEGLDDDAANLGSEIRRAEE